MSPRLRLLMACLLMLAVPVQGIASAGMTYCSGAAHALAAMTMGGEALAAGAGTKRDHLDMTNMGDGPRDTADEPAGGMTKLPGADHTCAVCAACNSPALAEFSHWPAFEVLPQAELAEPFMLIHAPPFRLPDKPPRA